MRNPQLLKATYGGGSYTNVTLLDLLTVAYVLRGDSTTLAVKHATEILEQLEEVQKEKNE